MRDVRYALRSLFRTPGFTLTAFLALTLAIGAATTVFSVVDRVLFRPLPYRDADRLVTVGADVRSRGQSNWAISVPEFEAWRQENTTLSDLAGHQTAGRLTLKLEDEPVEVAATAVTETMLDLLGVAPAIGRLFSAAEYTAGAAPALLLTDAAWRRLYFADPAVVGRSVTINDAPAMIAGVLPRWFVFPSDSARNAPDVLVPFVKTTAPSGARLTMIGRLAENTTIEAARTDLDRIAAARRGDSGMRNAVIDGASVEPLADLGTKRSRMLMTVLIGAVVALLLIGCANVANLLIARGTDRQGELSLRRALGASRGAIVRLLLAESAWLAGTAGLAGALVAYWAVAVIAPLVPADLQVRGPIEVNGRALVFTILASAICVVLAGLGPALGGSRAPLSAALGQASSRTTAGRVRVRQVIVGLQVALAVVLLVGGGLMVTTLARLMSVDLGYQADSALTMRVQLPRGKTYPPRSVQFAERALAAARGVPGVSIAGASEGVPLANTLYGGHYRVEGFPVEWMREGVAEEGACCTQTQWVSSDYLEAIGVPVVRGRRLTAADVAAGAPRVALIGERLARKFPAAMDPIGHYLVAADDPKDRRLIVGIVRDVRDMSLERPGLPTIYLPMEERGASAMTLVLRTHVEPLSIAAAARDALQRQAGPVVISNIATFDDVIGRAASGRRLNAWLFGAFGVLALLLTAVGIGSVVSYSVARRTREIGIRLALGASPASLRRLVVAGSIVPVVAGLLAGLAGAVALSRFVGTMLYGVTPKDAWTYSGVIALLAVTALAAAYLPARRAARVDPLVALRTE